MSFWTVEKTDLLRALAAKSLSGGAIGKELGCSRNAAISKMHRMGLHHSNNLTKPQQPPTYAPFNANNAAVDEKIPAMQRRTIFQLTAHTCRWPVGTVGEPDFFFCGDIPVDNSPYCVAHSARAFYPRHR